MGWDINGLERAMRRLKKIFPVFIALLAFALLCAGIYIAMVKVADPTLKYLLCGILILLAFLNLFSYFYYRQRFISLSNKVCIQMDKILKGDTNISFQNQETLTSKMTMEMEKIKDILETKVRVSDAERDEIQKMVSDIAHQLKTPLSNIRIYGDTLLLEDMTKAEEEKFVCIMQQQIGKLEFLIDSLVKMSRFESELIQLNKQNNSILQALGLAFSTVSRKAEKKNIELEVDCRETIQAMFDVKWTAEALENILDNAIKYTDEHGTVSVRVRTGEMYIEIQIKDTGCGIAPEHYQDIFKRFYREKGVEKIEGLGIGLYLARQIITMQGGYIMVKANKGAGSLFSVYLPV